LSSNDCRSDLQARTFEHEITYINASVAEGVCVQERLVADDENIRSSTSILSHALDGQYKTAKTNDCRYTYNIYTRITCGRVAETAAAAAATASHS
jgi:hypothetical protein